MLTVILATRNGARTLPGVLEAYCGLQAPIGGWKFVVVDNRSVDQSRAIIESYLDRLPLTYLFEETPGKNAALNAALAYIAGDLVVFTDDDAFPNRDWLVCLRNAADAQPSYDIFGGAVLPRWETTPADWILKWVPAGPVFALTSPFLLDGPTIPLRIFGPNMAVRTKVFEDGFRFDSSIGPRGKDYAMGSETEFVMRLAQHGHAAWHVHNATVEHFIRNFQMQKSWIFDRAVRLGRGHYRMTRSDLPQSVVTWAGVPRFLFRHMLSQAVELAAALLSFDEEKLFRARWKFNVIRGQMVEAYNLHKMTPLH